MKKKWKHIPWLRIQHWTGTSEGVQHFSENSHAPSVVWMSLTSGFLPLPEQNRLIPFWWHHIPGFSALLYFSSEAKLVYSNQHETTLVSLWVVNYTNQVKIKIWHSVYKTAICVWTRASRNVCA